MTSLDWFNKEISDMIPNTTIIQGKYKSLLKKAKAMHQKEITDAYSQGVNDYTGEQIAIRKDAETYYKSKYENNNSSED